MIIKKYFLQRKGFYNLVLLRIYHGLILWNLIIPSLDLVPYNLGYVGESLMYCWKEIIAYMYVVEEVVSFEFKLWKLTDWITNLIHLREDHNANVYLSCSSCAFEIAGFIFTVPTNWDKLIYTYHLIYWHKYFFILKVRVFCHFELDFKADCHSRIFLGRRFCVLACPPLPFPMLCPPACCYKLPSPQPSFTSSRESRTVYACTFCPELPLPLVASQ